MILKAKILRRKIWKILLNLFLIKMVFRLFPQKIPKSKLNSNNDLYLIKYLLIFKIKINFYIPKLIRNLKFLLFGVKNNHLKCNKKFAGFSSWDFQSFKNLAIVAPSSTLWSQANETLIYRKSNFIHLFYTIFFG